VIEVKSKIYSSKGEVVGELEVPEIFALPPRTDLIEKAFRSSMLSNRQPYGSYAFAGMRQVGHNLGANHGMSRIPRVAGSSRGVINASFVGGRSAHSPRSSKNLFIGINKKERKLALGSAISMTASVDYVKKRGHKIPDDLTLPLIADGSIESIQKTKDAEYFLEQIGLKDDLKRAKDGIKIRAGRGKMRGRTYKTPRSVLIVGSDSSKLRAFASIPGVEISSAKNLSIKKIAPGGKGGRLTIYTNDAIKILEEVR
jgi:large subunit ribosomal protein L4e